jgi:hypothetical protein
MYTANINEGRTSDALRIDGDVMKVKTMYGYLRQHQGQWLDIDPEFKSLIPSLSLEERSQLETNLLKEGCRDPLVVWQGHNILLDGHNRYEICTCLGIEFKTVEIELTDREAAHDWLIDNQLGRRNLTPEAVSYLRGKRYNLQKRQGERNDLTSGQSGTKLETAAHLAQEYKVGSRTIKRDAQYAQAVDTLASVVGEEIRPSLLSRKSKLTKKATIELAAKAATNPEEIHSKLKLNGDSGDNVSDKAQFPYQVGDVCLVNVTKDEPQLRGRGGCWAIVAKVHTYSCDLQLWNGIVEFVKPESLKPMQYSSTQRQQMQQLFDRLTRLRAVDGLEPAAMSLLSYLGSKKEPGLTVLEAKLLDCLETEYLAQI